jgi:hypothetical protein
VGQVLSITLVLVASAVVLWTGMALIAWFYAAG